MQDRSNHIRHFDDPYNCFSYRFFELFLLIDFSNIKLSDFEHKFIKGFADSRINLRKSATSI